VLKEGADITGTIKAPELNTVGHRRKEKRSCTESQPQKMMVQIDMRGTTPKQTLIHPPSISVCSVRGRRPVQHQQNKTSSCATEQQDVSETLKIAVSVG